MAASNPISQESRKSANEIRKFYDSVYHAEGSKHGAPSQRHHERLARRVGVREGDRILDVACGSGEWLEVCARRGARVTGVDISQPAIARCRRRLPTRDFRIHPAEHLPFSEGAFDLVSCLGAVEHFVDPSRALSEMLRVAKPGARILLLVPNADFLTRRLGLYRGTRQIEAKEEVRSIVDWSRLFNSAGLEVTGKWRDLHVLSRAWILGGSWPSIPLRFLQAVMLPFWPVAWQYQVYFLCKRRNDSS